MEVDYVVQRESGCGWRVSGLGVGVGAEEAGGFLILAAAVVMRLGKYLS